ncbi:tetratricopeptide repeat-containing sensor histidine kinase [Pedobacter changchengzhani]|uniref:tetratricopeptide repeat-containing sensor histidine kinase n=1 Tax=Pedobacter changchengzhani TaxID=2529274 RepID=UPI00140542DB|nr:ATP-binding protein [Pedobacter changchengzhani]
MKHYRYLNPDSALFFVNLGLQNARANNDELGEAALLNQLGMIEDNNANYKESKQKYLQAEAIYRKINNEEGIASTLVRLGVVEKRNGNFDKSLKYYFEALKLSEKNNNKIGTLEARVVIFELYFQLRNFKASIENLHFAEQLNNTLPNSNFSLNMYCGFGAYFIEMKQYDKAIKYINIGLPKSNKVEYNGLKIGLLKLLGIAYFKKGDFAKSVTTLKEALRFTREIKNVLREQSTLLELAKVNIKNNPDTAILYLNAGLKIANENKMFSQEIIFLNKLSDIYASKQDYQQALAFKNRSYQVSERVYYKEMSKQILSLESANELEKSNNQLTQLKLKSKEKTIVNNIILSITITITLLFIVTLFFFKRSRHFNKTLRLLNNKLADSNQQKDKFFSIVAHDLRSPLASTVSIMKLIQSRSLDEKTQDDVVNKLSLHCESSLEVLDNLLKWGYMQIKGTKINITEFEPLKKIKSNVALLKEATEVKNITIALQVAKNIKIKADSDQFDFIVRNLLSNAIKFTPIDGMINLSAEIEHDEIVTFKVIDNGMGISAERIAKLFELSSEGTSGTSNEGGTGLGLLICKEFIDAHAEKLTVESIVGKGTSFTFTFPGKIVE